MDCILVAQPVGAFDRVVHVPAPVVFCHAVCYVGWFSDETEEIYVKIEMEKYWNTYFAKAALIPPCAATVCDLVGNNFVTHAVFNPASVKPTAARSPAPPAPTTIALCAQSAI